MQSMFSIAVNAIGTFVRAHSPKLFCLRSLKNDSMKLHNSLPSMVGPCYRYQDDVTGSLILQDCTIQIIGTYQSN